ncbi:MAG: prominin family protein [Actinomycetota bacterium]|nr:prominin family protein [Actinomycetota bacterium]
MSGTDELFPDATQHPGVAVSPAVGGESAPLRRRRALGVAALILSLLAVLGDLIGIVVAFVALAGAVTSVGDTLNNVDNSLGTFIGVIVLEFAVYIGGVVFGLLAIVLGLIAAVGRRGCAAGIIGVVLGTIVVVTHVVLGLVIGSSGSVPGVTN